MLLHALQQRVELLWRERAVRRAPLDARRRDNGLEDAQVVDGNPVNRISRDLPLPGQPPHLLDDAPAEGGDTVPLNDILDANPIVTDTATSSGLLAPGASVTVQITARSAREHLSMAAMLLPTNDGFFSFQNLALPQGRDSSVAYGPAYDAGSEPNDELCISIPGPECGGAGGSPEAGGEGYVHIHSGIHGIGDLQPAQYDWRNPVARVAITRAR